MKHCVLVRMDFVVWTARFLRHISRLFFHMLSKVEPGTCGEGRRSRDTNMCLTRLILHTSPLNYVGAFCHQSGSSFGCLNLWWMSGCIERESWILWDVSFTCLGRCAFDQCGHTAWSRHLPTVGYRDLPKTLFSKSEFFWLAALFQHEDQVLLWRIWTFDFNCRSYRKNNSIIIHK